MLAPDFVLAASIAFVAVLFGLAFLVDRASPRGGLALLRSPVVYTLSLSVYCTSWTFYGAVGSAARNGLEFLTIYLGPTLVFVGWWWVLRKLVRVARVHRVTSIADLISSRYGKSPVLAVVVTTLAVLATTPYIALQLQSVTRSYEALTGGQDADSTALIAAVGMAVFAILFGTRNLDANERHQGVVAAIAVEALVKLAALIAIGVFVVWGLSDGPGALFADVPVDVIQGSGDVFGTRWAALTFLSATAIICLPRQFQVAVVENVDESHLRTASWLFPLYLFAMCLFILPIAIAGLTLLPAGADPDLYVLTLPLAAGRDELALFAFLGGFSSAMSMVIVAAIAVSTMVSNHIVVPLALRRRHDPRDGFGDVRGIALGARRVSIAGIMGFGLLYLELSGGGSSLAAIGTMAFAGVAQLLPSLLGGLFWRGATREGALAGLVAGALVWCYTLFLPSVAAPFPVVAAMLDQGPFGIAMLRPGSLFGVPAEDPLVYGLGWSLGVNVLLFLTVSAFSSAPAAERLQATQFVDVFDAVARPAGRPKALDGTADDLFAVVAHILQPERARAVFEDIARIQNRPGRAPLPTDAAIARLERELAGAVGASSANAIIARVTGGQDVSMVELIDIADETQKLIETSRALAERSAELQRAAHELREANDRLRSLDAQKDHFLSQVSHELRTPMTSIRSFAEILLETDDLDPDDRDRFLRIMHQECERLTRLLNELLDLGRLEAGTFDVDLSPLPVSDLVRDAVGKISGLAQQSGVAIDIGPLDGLGHVSANADRLDQVLLNLLSNALKYNTASRPRIAVRAARRGDVIELDVIDNGGGVGADEAAAVFDEYRRGRRSTDEIGAGLGLPISRAIMRKMGGDLTVEFTEAGASFFRVTLCVAAEPVARAAGR